MPATASDAGFFDRAHGFELVDGRKIPRMGFGTFDLGDSTETAVARALETGYRLIDCARFYGNEPDVGRALAATDVPREELFITSKVWNDRQIDGTVRESLEESLRDLRQEYLDLFLIHWPVRDRFLDTWEVLEQAREEGLVRSIGVSNFLPEHLQQILDLGGNVPVVDQMEYNPYLQDRATRSFCAERGIRFEAWSPFGRGGCLADPAIVRVADAHAATPSQIILNWDFANDVIPLPRSTDPTHIAANLRRLEVSLTNDESQALDALNRNQCTNEGVDPLHFNEILNALSSHF